MIIEKDNYSVEIKHDFPVDLIVYDKIIDEKIISPTIKTAMELDLEYGFKYYEIDLCWNNGWTLTDNIRIPGINYIDKWNIYYKLTKVYDLRKRSINLRELVDLKRLDDYINNILNETTTCIPYLTKFKSSPFIIRFKLLDVHLHIDLCYNIDMMWDFSTTEFRQVLRVNPQFKYLTFHYEKD